MSAVKTEESETVTEESVPANSRKREVTAVVASTTVTVLLGLAATGLIEKAGRYVKDAIAPKQPE